MNDCGTRDNNKRHNEALAIVEAFTKAGGKVRSFGVTVRNASGKIVTQKGRR